MTQRRDESTVRDAQIATIGDDGGMSYRRLGRGLALTLDLQAFKDDRPASAE
jgi:hypothetical protein